MKAFIAATGLAAGASAAVVARDQAGCCFSLTANGGVSGTVGQLDDGQNRVGGGHPAGEYCLNNGAITDGMGRGCILTPPTTQFQCDTGATPTGGFAVNYNGELTFNGSDMFYACPADDNMYNIYTMPVDNQPKCVKITLSTGGKCVPQKPMTNTCPAPSTVYKEKTVTATETKTEMGKPETVYVTKTEDMKCPAPSTMTETVSDCKTEVPPPETTTAPPMTTKPSPPPQPTGGKCPTDLSGQYEYPHLIVPVSSEKPDYAYGTQYNGKINSYTCSIFNFDIPQGYSGKTCQLDFLFPEQSQLQTSSYTISGSGDLVFSLLSGTANQQTTYNNAPSKGMELGSIHSPMPGNSYAVHDYSCPAGTTQSIEVCGTGDLSLEYFQDYNPSPIGVYITTC